MDYNIEREELEIVKCQTRKVRK